MYMTNTLVVTHQHTYNPNEASCIFGCGTWIGDNGICSKCGDYSENVSLCPLCDIQSSAYDDSLYGSNENK